MTRLGRGDLGYQYPLDSVLRAVRAEAVRAEVLHLREQITAAMRTARGSSGSSAEGRRWYGLERALELIPVPPPPAEPNDGPWTAHLGSVNTPIDAVDVGLYDDADGDPMPVRLRVIDGGDSSAAHAYLDPDEADQLAALLTEAARTARAAAEARNAPPEIHNLPAPPLGPRSGMPYGPGAIAPLDPSTRED